MPKARSRQAGDDSLWDSQRELLRILWLVDNKTLEQVKEVMAGLHGFRAEDKLEERKLEGKDSIVFYDGVLVPSTKVQRGIDRKRAQRFDDTGYELPPGVEIRTPKMVCSNLVAQARKGDGRLSCQPLLPKPVSKPSDTSPNPWTVMDSFSKFTTGSFGQGWDVPRMPQPNNESTLLNPITQQNLTTMLPFWAMKDLLLQDLPWIRFHRSLHGLESLKVLDSPVQSESNFADNTIAEQFDQQEKHSVFERTAKAMDGLATFKTQRGAGFDLEEVMPEPFRIEGSNNIEAPNTLSANSLTIRLADVSLFLVANNLLDGSELVALIERIFDADQDYVFEKLFTLRSPTIHALCCRMLESISDKFDHQGCDKLLERLLRCGLDRSILAGPTGGRCIQLAITRRNEPLALLLLRNGVPRYPKLGLQGPFNRTLTQLAHLVGEQRVLRVLYGLPEDHPPVARPPRNEDERALREACEQRDFEQIQFLLDGGTDVDCVRDAIMWHTAFIRWETILEWAFFNDQQCYDMLLPYSQFEKSFWSLPGILTAANAGRQQLDAYLTRKRCSERDDPGTVLDIAISKGIQNHKTKEVRTMLGLELVSHRLDLEKVLVEAAHDLQLEIMDDLLQLGADLGALNSIQRTIDKHLWDALEKGPGNGALKQLLTFGCFSLEEAFVRSLNVLSAGCGPSDELENLKFLVEQGLDLDSAIFVKDDIDMRTPLQLAMELGTMEMVEYLVDAKGLVSNKTRGASHTDLGEAVSLMYPEIVRLLLQRNAEVGGFANDREMTVLEISVTRDDARGSSSDEDMEVFHALLEAGADLNGPSCRKRTSNWNTTLTTAIMNPHADKQIRIALDRGAGIHQMGGGKNARTPLQAAAESGRIDITKELLRRGACVNAPAAPDHGRTALQAACGGGKQSTELISLLLAEGADVSAPAARIYGRTALQALCSSETTSSELMALLIEKGADINAPPARNGGITALQGAAIMGNIKIAMLLINMGADINAPPSRHEGRMALDGAAEHGRLDTVQLLLTFKAECRVPGDSGFDSAIRLAEENGHFAIADILRGRKYE